MSAPWNDLESKVEAAMLAVVNGLTLSGDSDEEALVKNTGLDDEAFGVPNVICSCPSVEDETVRGTGIFRARAAVTVTSNFNDATLTTHRARVATVRDAFMQTDIAATLSAALADFHCYEARVLAMRSSVGFRDQGETNFGAVTKNVLELEMVCCGSDIS